MLIAALNGNMMRALLFFAFELLLDGWAPSETINSSYLSYFYLLHLYICFFLMATTSSPNKMYPEVDVLLSAFAYAVGLITVCLN
jgi:hypothetical protein